MDKTIKLGVIGMSEGNGHPYSWSAIFNGYDEKYMKECPFPVIPGYLSRQKFPKDSIKEASVTHIWTQDKKISNHIANAARIPHVTSSLEDLIGNVDGILLARDDAENHYKMSLPFLEAGLPIFIDKPLAFNVETARNLFDNQTYTNQIFTCSSLRFAKEFPQKKEEIEQIGKIKLIDATIPKDWKKYGVHIIEPVISFAKQRGLIVDVKPIIHDDIQTVVVTWENLNACFRTMGSAYCPISIRIFGEDGHKEFVFKDTFHAFKSSLQYFIDLMNNKIKNIPRKETLEIVEIIERGTN